MKRAFGDYRRLARGALSCSSLWAAPGHLLYIKGSGIILPITEEYLRFELRRIRALAIIPTRTGAVLNVIFSVCAAAALAVAAGGYSAAAAVEELPALKWLVAGGFGLLSVLFLVLLLYNWLRGPTCLFSIQTPVRRELIRPLRRLRRARAVMAQLDDLIAAASAGGSVAHAQEPAGSPSPPPLPEVRP